MKQSPETASPDSYGMLVRDLSSLIEAGRRAAVRDVNTLLVATYWFVGKRIVEYEQKGRTRAEYGEELLGRIAHSLRPRFGEGFTERNLRHMRQFYLIYPDIRHTLCAEFSPESKTPSLNHRGLTFQAPLSWSHYRLLMRIEEKPKRDFYEIECQRGTWSVRQLDRQIQSMLYERMALSRRKESLLSKAHENQIIQRPEDAIKDPYVLEFLNLKDEYSESDLEDALILHMEHFLLELGSGFTFVARQKRFEVVGRPYRIDLVLFHRELRSLALIELKINEFNYSDAGQMNFYLNWAKKEAKLPGENDPFGIILVSGKDKGYVQYALGGMENRIFVSTYIPKLPSPDELTRELERARMLFLEQKAARKTIEIEKEKPNHEKMD